MYLSQIRFIINPWNVVIIPIFFLRHVINISGTDTENLVTAGKTTHTAVVSIGQILVIRIIKDMNITYTSFMP